MGFTDLEANRKALKATGGLLMPSVEYLTDGPPPQSKNSSSVTSAPYTPQNVPSPQKPTMIFTFPRLGSIEAEKVLQCAAMGFNDEGKIRHALSQANWKVKDAVGLLIQDRGLESNFSSLEASNLPFSVSTISSNISPIQRTGSNSSVARQQPPSRSSSFSSLPQQQPLNESSRQNSSYIPQGAVPLFGQNQPLPPSHKQGSPHNPFGQQQQQGGNYHHLRNASTQGESIFNPTETRYR